MIRPMTISEKILAEHQERLNQLAAMVSALSEKELVDSFTFGTPSTGGESKVYLDYSDLQACIDKLDKVREVRKYAAAGVIAETVVKR